MSRCDNYSLLLGVLNFCLILEIFGYSCEDESIGHFQDETEPENVQKVHATQQVAKEFKGQWTHQLRFQKPIFVDHAWQHQAPSVEPGRNQCQ